MKKCLYREEKAGQVSEDTAWANRRRVSNREWQVGHRGHEGQKTRGKVDSVWVVWVGGQGQHVR